MTYDTINNGKILLSSPYAKRPGMLSGAVILVDCGDKYVVSTRSNDEPTGIPRKEWNQGNYFCHGMKHQPSQAESLKEALEVFQALEKREGC